MTRTMQVTVHIAQGLQPNSLMRLWNVKPKSDANFKKTGTQKPAKKSCLVIFNLNTSEDLTPAITLSVYQVWH